MKILVVRFSSIGDIILTTPIVRALKEQLNDPEIHYVTKYAYADILSNNPYIDQLHLMKDGLDDVLPDLKAIKFDWVIDLHRSIRSRILRNGLRRPSRSFPKKNIQKWIYVNLGINLLPKVHIVDRYFEAVKHLNVKNDGKGLDLFIEEEDRSVVNLLPESIANGYAAITVGAKQNGKQMSHEKFAELINRIDQPMVLLGGPEDKELADSIHSQFPDKTVSMAGKLSLRESSAVIQRAEVVIAYDTGMMHFAAALNKKIISIWGCTTPVLGMSPYKPAEGSKIIMSPAHGMRPCSKLGNRCRYTPKCIDQHEVGRIVEELKS